MRSSRTPKEFERCPESALEVRGFRSGARSNGTQIVRSDFVATRLRRDRLRNASPEIGAVPEARPGRSRAKRDEVWRRERDSNPRNRFRFSGFQDHRHRPLGHLSTRTNIGTVSGRARTYIKKPAGMRSAIPAGVGSAPTLDHLISDASATDLTWSRKPESFSCFLTESLAPTT